MRIRHQSIRFRDFRNTYVCRYLYSFERVYSVYCRSYINTFSSFISGCNTLADTLTHTHTHHFSYISTQRRQLQAIVRVPFNVLRFSDRRFIHWLDTRLKVATHPYFTIICGIYKWPDPALARACVINLETRGRTPRLFGSPLTRVFNVTVVAAVTVRLI